MHGPLTLAFLAAVLAAACAPMPAGETPPALAPTRSEPPPGTLTIAVAGDIHFQGPLRERLATPATALAPATAPLAAADLAIVNLETSIGEGGRPEPGKRFLFQAPASAALAALAAAGIDVATLANNHALDFGRAPLPGAFAAIDRARAATPPLQVVGLGRNATGAFTPALSTVRGITVATIGATTAGLDPTADPTGQWAATDTEPGTADAIDPTRLLAAVAAANQSADVVVVFMHWGIQRKLCPSDDQRSLAAALVERGADIVVGSHAHVLQGDGRLGPGYVAYGLGNYAWNQPSSEPTGVLTLVVEPAADRTGRARVVDAQWEPQLIGADGLPRALPATRLASFRRQVAERRACAGLVAPG